MNPCLNSGKCLSKVDKFSCQCSDSFYGNICQYSYSSRILNSTELRRLNSLISVPQDQKWNLIYRASSDGFKASDFHSKCSKVKKTLTLIKATSSNIFGGYTDADWSGNGWKSDTNAFLFSFINKDNTPFRMNCTKTDNAIYSYPSFGPVFGLGVDLFIGDKSNLNSKSYSNLGSSYSHPIYKYDSNEAKQFLAGTENFTVYDIEVYIKDRIIKF